VLKSKNVFFIILRRQSLGQEEKRCTTRLQYEDWSNTHPSLTQGMISNTRNVCTSVKSRPTIEGCFDFIREEKLRCKLLPKK